MLKKQTLVLAFIALVGGFSLASTPSHALECKILPQSICDASEETSLENSSIWKTITMVLQILTAGIGIVATCALGYFAFLYATAGDNASQTKEAKEKIRNTIVGIVLYGLMYILIEFLVPGGVFS